MQESYIIGVAIRTTRNTVSCGWQLLNRSMENTTRIFIAVAEIKKCADMGIDIVCVLAMLMCDPVIIFYFFFLPLFINLLGYASKKSGSDYSSGHVGFPD